MPAHTLCHTTDWPTRLLCPWNFPGKNTVAGCHFLLQGIFPTQASNPILCLLQWQAESLPLVPPGKPINLISAYSLSRVRLCEPMDCSPLRLLCPWDSPGKDTGVGCHFLLQGIFPTQEPNLGLLHCRQILSQLSYKGSIVDLKCCLSFPQCF